jgi:hypothetical protein
VTRIILNKKVAAPLVYDVKNVLTVEKEVLKIDLKYQVSSSIGSVLIGKNTAPVDVTD